ncbi:MAG: ParB/RepB/Spo0J family partition protein [Terrisporobacter othiniensis]|uniref:ParB/RepB/Spo0J family partition protein n=1 Tax=Terrisporobacter petrolearius TaxID=1460447 RepID=UPI001F2C25D2|nr:ParB/RepB/Spo0J family partition protein [Terrisporobacter petrolearius]MDU4862558.1 ParB/RepB/Spo0J family partition protein [Terrisporobacter othiniensis]MDU6996493.1 ParB/RepB/Spo0J family partition protein [Terrisporobacter othiniensis]UPA30451.1 ParB/RepB/Spo0J family partition protein [Terrisporobacter glycolicus]
MDNTPRRSKRLGKGLSALIPEINDEVDKKEIVQIKLSNIRPNKNQPRKEFDEDKIKALSDSIKNVGVLQPIVLKPTDEANYMIIAGERRYRASIMAGKEEIPAVIKDIPVKDIMEIALIENLQREDLNAIEEALAYKSLIDNYKVTQEELSEAVGKSRPHITNTLRLLNLQKKVIKMIENGEITPGHGKALLRIENHDQQLEIANKIVKDDLSVRVVEEMAKKIICNKQVKKPENEQKDIYIIDVEERLSNIFGTQVNISKGKKKGKIEIVYNNQDELNDILSMIMDED